jgi:hypothetical protein
MATHFQVQVKYIKDNFTMTEDETRGLLKIVCQYTVKAVYTCKVTQWEPEHVAFMSSCPLYTG